MMNGVAPAAWQDDVKTRWPDGSLRHALVSFRATVPSGGAITVNFVNNANPCSSGSKSACDSAALTQAGMLNFDIGQGPGRWAARIEATASGIVQGADAHAMIANGQWTYWLRGPVVTQVIVEDRSPALSQDFGWQCSSNCTGDYSSATWTAASSSTYQSLHPIFVAGFYPGYQGIEVDYIIENVWGARLQDQRYSVKLYANYPESAVYTNPGIPHWGRTRWHKKFWSGATPGRVRTDYNLPYLIESRAVPNFDLTRQVPSGTIAGVLSHWAATDQATPMGDYVAGGTHLSGFWYKYMPMTGGREEIGLFPTWAVRYLYTFHTTANGNDLYNVMLGNGDVSGYTPIHVRESNSDPNFKYCALSQTCLSAGLDTVPAWGLSVSRDAHATVGGTFGSPVAPLSSAHNWTLDAAHQGSFPYIPYLITGDWYYLQELNFWASYNLLEPNGATDRFYSGHGDWDYIREQIRGDAWWWRNIAHASVMAPDGSADKAYFTQKLLNNIAVREGKLDLRNGYGYANDNTKWQWGYTQAAEILDVTNTSTHRPNPLNFWDFDAYASFEEIDTTVTQYIIPQWQVHFMMVVLGHLEELGFPTMELRKAVGKNMINQLQNPNFNPWLIATYRTPAIMNATGTWPSSWSEALSGFLAVEQARTNWPTNATDPDSGYNFVALGAASFLPGITDGPYTGDGAWNWFTGKLNLGLQNDNPKWAFVPRAVVAPPNPTCDLNGDGKVDSTDVQLAVNSALSGVYSATSDLDQDGHNTVIDAQRVVNAALGGACRVGP